MSQTLEQRNEFLTRHLANSLFQKLSQNKWHYVPVGETPKFQIYGAGQAPPKPGGSYFYSYAWLATVSLSVPRLMLPMHAIFLDEAIYTEVLGQFTAHTQHDWHMLVDSGTKRLYYVQDGRLRRNTSVKTLMCSLAFALIERLREMKLIVPVERLDAKEMLESHQEQLVLAALRDR